MPVQEQNEKRNPSDLMDEDMTTTDELMDYEFGKKGESLREEFEKQIIESRNS